MSSKNDTGPQGLPSVPFNPDECVFGTDTPQLQELQIGKCRFVIVGHHRSYWIGSGYIPPTDGMVGHGINRWSGYLTIANPDREAAIFLIQVAFDQTAEFINGDPDFSTAHGSGSVIQINAFPRDNNEESLQALHHQLANEVSSARYLRRTRPDYVERIGFYRTHRELLMSHLGIPDVSTWGLTVASFVYRSPPDEACNALNQLYKAPALSNDPCVRDCFRAFYNRLPDPKNRKPVAPRKGGTLLTSQNG